MPKHPKNPPYKAAWSSRTKGKNNIAVYECTIPKPVMTRHLPLEENEVQFLVTIDKDGNMIWDLPEEIEYTVSVDKHGKPKLIPKNSKTEQ